LEAWLKAKQTEDATAACAAAVATVPTLLPNTMDALMEIKATEVSTKVSEKVAKKETKAIFKQLAKQFGKNAPGGGKANPTPPTKGTRTEASEPKNKQQSRRNKSASTVTTLQAKSHGTPNSNRNYTTRKNHLRNDPGPVQATKRDKTDKAVKANNTRLEETDLQA
jgi:hypothetical protein